MALPYIYRTATDKPAVNFVAIDDRLVTAGQPSVTQLRQLKQEGYSLVINLAPPDSYASIEDEGYHLGSNGITYVSLPVNWEKPNKTDFEKFSALLKLYRDQKVMVHCQANYRASSFVFLYRVIHEDISTSKAYEKVHKVWVPNEKWQMFIEQQLKDAGKSAEVF